MHYKCTKKKNEKKIGKACHKNKESLMKSLSQKIKMKQAKKNNETCTLHSKLALNVLTKKDKKITWINRFLFNSYDRSAYFFSC